MKEGRKRAAAAELLWLTKFGQFRLPDDVPASTRSMLEAMKDRHFEALVGLYAEHFSEDQLQAQLDFYRSEIGQTILRVQERIGEAYHEILPTLTANVVSRGVVTGAEDASYRGEHEARFASAAVDHSDRPTLRLPAKWTIHIASGGADLQISFKGAIGFDDTLALVNETTPFSREFVASKVTAMFASSTKGVPISAEMIGDFDGHPSRTGFTAGKGKFVFDPHGPMYFGSGTSF